MTCSMEACERPAHSKGMCWLHRRRVLRYGSPFARRPVTLPASERFWRLVDRSDDPNACWPWRGYRRKPSPQRPGAYGIFWFNHQPRQRRYSHRVALELTLGTPLSPAALVCHTCDNPPCCNPAHLFVGTHADNNRDMLLKGRHPRSGVSLTADDVIGIRSMAGSHSQAQIAAHYGVSQSNVSHVVNRKSWRSVG